MDGVIRAKTQVFQYMSPLSTWVDLIAESFIYEISFKFFSVILCDSILLALTFLLQSMANWTFVLSGTLLLEL